jgi:hypothetical protein
MSVRRSVYFHASTRRFGRPNCSNSENAAFRRARTVSPPGSAARDWA